MSEWEAGVYVARERCSACLFTPDRIVPGSRAAELIRGARARDGFFVCHRFSILGDAAPYGGMVACRAFFERFPEAQPFQIAERLGRLFEISEEDVRGRAAPDR